ncbi:hypothetical protein JOF56_005161 [Kibdelosporangium banguiense]|uniref:DUF2461 domain-containing protein n=1 Tax=Kibdelosporangium banguiense TaxID=1365924 RepID=A0ABS4TLM3_9PSEU|nr:DUF2461 family protein [Kibdelosporangium banguiense]MBP2324776.1 hypothetical protein [Kibdelosporangium banguiense]
MIQQFSGWPDQALDILLRLDGEPSSALREELRKDRERLVRKPMIDLLNDVADADPAYADFSVWSYAKHTWWWQHQTATIRLARKVEIGLRFDLDGLHVKGAWHYPDPGQIELYRAAVAGKGSGLALAQAIDTLRHKGYEISGDVMKVTPPGYSPDHERAGLLRHRSVVASRALDRDDWLATAKALDWVLDTAADLNPMLSWFAEHVTAAEDP